VPDNSRSNINNQNQKVVVSVYGTRWCAATQLVRRYLDRYEISYSFRDLDRDTEAANQVRWWTGGYLSHPVLQIGGEILIEPLSNEINSALTRQGLIK
jgi:mycoredoxin